MCRAVIAFPQHLADSDVVCWEECNVGIHGLLATTLPSLGPAHKISRGVHSPCTLPDPTLCAAASADGVVNVDDEGLMTVAMVNETTTKQEVLREVLAMSKVGLQFLFSSFGVEGCRWCCRV